MKRFGVMMRRHRWAVLAALALLVIAGTAAIFSGAIFNYRTANPGNTFTAGILKHSNNRDGAAIMNVSLMKPGDSETGTVVITNTGNLDGDFTLTASISNSESGATIDPVNLAGYTGLLEDVLVLTVEEDGVEIYTSAPDPIAGFNVPIGTILAGESRTYDVIVTFPDGGTPAPPDPLVVSGDNLYKGASLEMAFVWDEVQL